MHKDFSIFLTPLLGALTSFAALTVLAVLTISQPAYSQNLLDNIDLTSPEMTEAETTRSAIIAQIENAAKSGEALDLSHKRLSGLDLSNLNLSGAILRSARLNGTSLVGADLSRAVLDQAWMLNADLSKANLSNAHLFQAQMIGAILNDANLSGARLASNLTKAKLINANLSHVDFEYARLDRANLTDADLRSATMGGAYLMGTNVTRVKFDKADMTSTTLKELIGAETANLETAANLNRSYRE